MITSQKASNSWLCGKIKCGECGYALIAKQFNTRKGRYLFCSNKMNSKSCRGAGTLYTDEGRTAPLQHDKEKALNVPYSVKL